MPCQFCLIALSIVSLFVVIVSKLMSTLSQASAKPQAPFGSCSLSFPGFQEQGNGFFCQPSLPLPASGIPSSPLQPSWLHSVSTGCAALARRSLLPGRYLTQSLAREAKHLAGGRCHLPLADENIFRSHKMKHAPMRSRKPEGRAVTSRSGFIRKAQTACHPFPCLKFQWEKVRKVLSGLNA